MSAATQSTLGELECQDIAIAPRLLCHPHEYPLSVSASVSVVITNRDNAFPLWLMFILCSNPLPSL